MKMGESAGAGERVTEHESQSRKESAKNVMKVALGKIYRRPSEGEMEC